MKINYSTNYSGYIPVLRSVLLLVKAKVITLPQLAAYIYLVMQADFDTRHKYYAAILPDNKELAKEVNLDSTTIFRYRKDLIEKGLLTEKNGMTLVTNHYMFELGLVQKLAKLPPANLQELFAKPQENVADFESLIANLHNEQLQKTSQSFSVSSKGKSGSSAVERVLIKGEVRTKEGDGQINRCTSLTPEEMKWIDENVTETIS